MQIPPVVSGAALYLIEYQRHDSTIITLIKQENGGERHSDGARSANT